MLNYLSLPSTCGSMYHILIQQRTALQLGLHLIVHPPHGQDAVWVEAW
jgi:hypothetical protein